MANDNQFRKDIISAMEAIDPKNEGAKVADIISQMRISIAYSNEDEENLYKRVNNHLAQGASPKRKEKIFLHAKGKKGQNVRSTYKLIRIKKEKDVIKTPNTSKSEPTQLLFPEEGEITKKNKRKKQPLSTSSNPHRQNNINTTHLGKGGEFAVMSELLYRGYNANPATVDDGVDIIAWKGRGVFFIQVKTTIIEGGEFRYSIKKDSFDRYYQNNMFYVFVLRTEEERDFDKYVNWYLVFPASTIQQYIDNGQISIANNTYEVKFRHQGKKVWIVKGGNEYEISNSARNRFDLIKE